MLRHEDALFVATKSAVIYRISISESTVNVQELFKVKVEARGLFSHGKLFKGTVSWSEITQLDQEGRSIASTPKIFSINQDVQSAFAVEYKDSTD
ncbi:hypothetical protein BGZ95_004133 [Linnemannia exigua]|uniref:Uncharacterized protein n=1 Tax=Linnemannia exigua TaxID=604196 RepID=A0AAD4DJT8_9FUNG|nr:hypothetical protein BGZ95_004133 [Linnemannia exigua]